MSAPLFFIGSALALASVALGAEPDHGWAFVPPKDSGVVNVKDYGAKGDGVTDDTAAIAQAITANIDKSRYRSNPFIWFPNGTYLVTRPIESRLQMPGVAEGENFSAAWRSMLMMIGETRVGTVIRTVRRPALHARIETRARTAGSCVHQ